MTKQFLATDFDGTLYRNRTIALEDQAAIHRWRESGRLFGFVTGRGNGFPERISDFGLQCDFYLCYNGALLMDHAGNILREARMNLPIFRTLEEAFRKNSKSDHFTIADHRTDFFQYSAVMLSLEEAAAFSEILNIQFGDQVSAYANGLNINIVKKGESKAMGVRHAARHFGLQDEECAVVGDDLNDLDMILSLNGWAVDTARPKVLAKAPNICRSVGALIDTLLI